MPPKRLHDPAEQASSKAKALAEVRRLKADGHLTSCKAVNGEKMFDYDCALCVRLKDYVQANADLAAQEAYEEVWSA